MIVVSPAKCILSPGIDMVIGDKAGSGGMRLEKGFKGEEDMHSGENTVCLGAARFPLCPVSYALLSENNGK